MNTKTPKMLVLSDCNLASFTGFFNHGAGPDRSQAQMAPYGQVMSALLNSEDPLWKENHDAVLVWTRPEGVIPSFGEKLEGKNPDFEKIMKEVDLFAQALAHIKDRTKSILVPIWVIPSYHRGLENLRSDGLANLLWKMNMRMMFHFDETPNIHFLNTSQWVETIGEETFNPKFWYCGKLPFSNSLFKLAAQEIKAACETLRGSRKKLIVLDLDDTLWGGIVGDLGWENVKLGGHDPIGEAFVDFQRGLKALQRRGILLAIASKNEESVALEAINNHPEMVLRDKDFVNWRINWNDKAQNIVEIVNELNLGMNSVVFIDDNPVERNRVASALPEVLVPDWPTEKMLYRKTLMQMRCFDAVGHSREDEDRTAMYLSEQKRKKEQVQVGSVEEWLKELELVVEIDSLNSSNQQRVLQLMNKTNQMNLSTRRLTETELKEWFALDPSRHMWTFRVKDKFGDSGLTGIVSVEAKGDRCHVIDFILSCRVFGRQIETVMFHTVIQHALKENLRFVVFKYQKTAKNKPCLDFLKNSGCENQEPNFLWDTGKEYPVADFICTS